MKSMEGFLKIYIILLYYISNLTILDAYIQVSHGVEDVGQCKYHPCLNAGTCTAQTDGYRCSCKVGWIGQNCEKRSSCIPSPCHHGTCSPNIDGYVCTCKSGFKGLHCDTIDHCNPSPCQNKGICTDTSKGVMCECPTAFKGKFCELESHCQPLNPCMNGGSCIELIAKYQCNCPPSYHGENCESFLAPTKPSPTAPPKHGVPQPIPAPENNGINEIHQPLINQFSGNEGNITPVKEEKTSETDNVINSGNIMVPHTKSTNLETENISKKPFVGAPVSDNYIIHIENERGENKTTNNAGATGISSNGIPSNDDRFQTHFVEQSQTNKSRTTDSEASRKNFLEPSQTDNLEPLNTPDTEKTKTKQQDIPDLTSDEPEALLENKGTRDAKVRGIMNSDFRNDNKKQQLSNYEMRNYLQLEEIHKKKSIEENPRFDYLHLHEAHGDPTGDDQNRDYLHLNDVRASFNGNGHNLFTMKNSDDDIHTLTFDQDDDYRSRKVFYKSHNEEEAVTPQLEHQMFNGGNSEETIHKTKVPSVEERSHVNNTPKLDEKKRKDGYNNYVGESKKSQPKQNIETVATKGQNQVEKIYQAIDQAKENAADVMKDNATEEEQDKQKHVEQKANQIYAGIQAGISNLPNIAQEAQRANDAMININSQIQAKMQQSQSPKKFWGDKKSQPKQNIETVASKGQNQVEKIYQAIDQAKENAADLMKENATKEEQDKQKLVEQKANQIYAGIQAGISNLPNIAQEAQRANDAMININSQIQAKMQQSQKLNKFWEDKFTNQKDAYSTWRKKALINFHKRNPNKPLPKNTVSLSKNSLCPGFCKLFCDPWCVNIGCCQANKDQPSAFKNIGKDPVKMKNLGAYPNKKGPSKLCQECNENADCIRGECRCKTGFHGDGRTCSIDTCLLCHLDADCLEDRCVCKKGFFGDGYECKRNSFRKALCSKCSPKADCIGGDCFCRKNYYGDGKSCWPLPII